MNPKEFIKKHWVGLGVGSIGWLVNIFHFIYDYFTYGHDLLTHFRIPDNILVFVWIPGFMLAGYIYDRKLMSERRLAASEERHRVLVETALDGINIVDTQGNFVLVNPEYCRMLGYGREELMGESFLITLPVRAREEGMRLFRKAIREPVKPYIYEGKNLRKDGSIMDVQIKWNYLYRDGKVDGTIAIVRDITERKKAEESLKMAEREWKSTFDAASEGICLIDEDHNLLRVNRALAGMLGVDSSELIGMKCYEVFHGSDAPINLCPMEKALRTKKPEYAETYEPFLKRYLSFSTAPILENGVVKAVVHITKDITERKRAEEQVRRYAQELERSNRLKDLFTDIMRHDILNPVAVIRGVSQILRQESSGKIREGLEKIGKGAFKIEEMVESAARLSKLDAEEELKFEKRDLNIIFKEVVENFRPMLMEKGMRAEYLPRGKRVAMVCSVIEDVFANLLSNAVKYSPSGSKVTIDILDEGEAWKVMVADQGEGVPGEYKEAIFERFERGGKKGVRGTGLGLAIVKRIVKLHKGRVWVEDNTPQGSIFYVVIPKNGKEVRD